MRVAEALDGEGELADRLGDPVRGAEAAAGVAQRVAGEDARVAHREVQVLAGAHVARDGVAGATAGGGKRDRLLDVANASASSSTTASSPRAVRSARPARVGVACLQRGGDLAEGELQVTEDARRGPAHEEARIGREQRARRPRAR